MVAPVLHSLHLYGVFAGVALSLIAWAEGRGRALWIAPLVLAGLCAISEFGITVAIEAVRPYELGPQAAPGAAGRFALLHRTSQVIFLVVWLGTLALSVAHARADTQGAAAEPSGTPLKFV